MNLKGIVPDERYINLDTGEQRGEEFLRINPLGGIPALIDREAPGPVPPMTQSLAILEFLEDIHPASPILASSNT
jgi:maleylacetoacetate isomerase/maleylpyruvate isomerase